MRHSLVLVGLLLPLTGCNPPAQEPAGYYAQPGYPAPGPGYAYGQPEYPPPGYPPGAYYPDANVYPGYGYNNGEPSLLVDGAATPLVVFGGGWGYWDRRHNWHHAPDAVSRHLEEQREAGGFHHGGRGFAEPRPDRGFPPGGDFHPGGAGFGQPRAGDSLPPPGQPNRALPGFQPNEPPRSVAMPAAAPHPGGGFGQPAVGGHPPAPAAPSRRLPGFTPN